MNALFIFLFYIVKLWIKDSKLIVLDAPELICLIIVKVFIDVITHSIVFFVVHHHSASFLNLALVALFILWCTKDILSTNFSPSSKLWWSILLLDVPRCTTPFLLLSILLSYHMDRTPCNIFFVKPYVILYFHAAVALLFEWLVLVLLELFWSNWLQLFIIPGSLTVHELLG